MTNFSVLRQCKWFVREPKVPTSTPVTVPVEGTSEFITAPTEVLPKAGRPAIVDIRHQIDTDMFSTPTERWGMDQYSSTNSGKRMSLRNEQSLYDLETSPIDLAPASLHLTDDWRPAHEMEETMEQFLDPTMNEEAMHSNVPTLQPSISMPQLVVMGAKSAAGSASPFLGWVLIIVAFAVAELLFACCSFRSWTREADESKPAQLDLTILCDDTNNIKAVPMDPVILFDDVHVSQRDPTNPIEANCTTP